MPLGQGEGPGSADGVREKGLNHGIVAATDLIRSPPLSLYDVDAETLDGQAVSLKAYEGKALLIVNTASKCGFTPQYEGLEALYRKYRDRGFEVLAFPCNQFGAQEPGNADEIATSKNQGDCRRLSMVPGHIRFMPI